MTADLSRAEVEANVRVLALIELQISAEIAIDGSFCKTFIVSVMCVKPFMTTHLSSQKLKPILEFLQFQSFRYMQSHYREVARWEIFMEQELRNFRGRFFDVFMGQKFILKTLQTVIYFWHIMKLKKVFSFLKKLKRNLG